MITLTNTIPVTTVLGSTNKTAYDRLRLTSIVYDVTNKSISGSCEIVVSTNAQAQAIQGSYTIPTTGAAILQVTIPSLPFYASLPLTTAQQATVAGWVQTAQNQVEGGLVAVGVIAGVQSAGS
jgi:hypothetical protein